MSLESLRQHLEQERHFNERMAGFYEHSGLTEAAEHRRRVVAQRDEWLADLTGLNGAEPPKHVEVVREHPVKHAPPSGPKPAKHAKAKKK